ncbi:hypothetical protein PV08_03530 [Exophiala spinifera]|uniref:Uncharacterized protein n=1 Tax=Exophiala spinifera TaxID=91928 RepID=A0A0D1YVC2_9EURO|nr:uncharacterized protein PV08_03530 [Exophiala spinifera]KIW19236.1 hypothetical protein PV08_03530 [Exophiala spinifera]
MSTFGLFRQFSQSSKVATLLAITLLFAPHVAHAALALTFFEHSSCNAGTSFQSYNDPNALQADTSCHQLPNGTVALYVNQIDQGCTLRIYLSSDCSPLAPSPAGLLVPAGNCFFVEEGVDLGSWRPDCAGVDYSSSNGLDKGNSYNNNTNDGSADIYSALVTATGVVTVTAASSSSTTASSSSATAASIPGNNTTSGDGNSGGNATTTMTTTTTNTTTTGGSSGASQTSHSGSDSVRARAGDSVSTVMTMVVGMGMGVLALTALC